jgi:sugar transferase (PEP-CTERM system associated)
VIRLFNVHYPKRTILLITGEAVILSGSFVLAAVLCLGRDSAQLLGSTYDLYKVLGVILVAQLSMYCSDLYDGQQLSSGSETISRLLVIFGALSLLLAAISLMLPNFLIGGRLFSIGLAISTVALVSWRAGYVRLAHKLFVRERVYVLGDGERGRRLIEAIQTRHELGMELVGWSGLEQNGVGNREALGERLVALARRQEIDTVIVALSDRRTTMPVRELLDLRLCGVKVDDATTELERISGKIEVDELRPSWLIFCKGFRNSAALGFVHRVVSLMASFILLLLAAPLIPVIIVLIKVSSTGPVLYRQKRVGQNGVTFDCYKFRTMRADAEADTGPTWAGDEDPRITRTGRWLRRSRLDEIPQLWNLLRGDMAFCGPRPERPEFVERLAEQIPYYNLRHILRPGITGWAQVNYKYGNTVADAKEKLRYDLFYIKNRSIGLDLLIYFRTIKTVLMGRGAQ